MSIKNVALDHVFIMTEPQAKAADLLLDLGFIESFSRHHEGQGTSNRRFVFANAMLEFLWVRDENEANHGTAKALNFPKRSKPPASPFGVVLNNKLLNNKLLSNKLANQQNDTLDKNFWHDDLEMPFAGWAYQPDYFKAQKWVFHIGNNASDLREPLCIYAPFMAPKQNVKPDVNAIFQSITHVNIITTNDDVSDILHMMDDIDNLSIKSGDAHLMTITFDHHKDAKHHDFRPDIPLVIQW